MTSLTWNPRYQLLNHCRGIAVIAVVFFHGFGTSYNVPVHRWVKPLQGIASMGWLGVDLFFVISGYCIAANIYGCFQKGRTPTQFIKGRLWRIVPTYWLATLVAMGIGILAMPFNHTTLRNNIPFSLVDWIGNALLLQTALGRTFYLLVCWSLVYEMVFYTIAMVLFYIGRLASVQIILWILPLSAAFALVGRPQQHLFPWVQFVFGSLVFYGLWQAGTHRSIQRLIAVTLLVIGVGAGGWIYNNTGSVDILVGGLFGLLLLALYNFDDQMASWPGGRWLEQIGIISYSLYLLHVSLQGRFVNMAMRVIPFNSLWVIVVQIGGMAVAILGSAVFYRLVEKPFHKQVR